LSLFDPDPHELALLIHEGTWVSGEALPELPLPVRQELERKLKRIGIEVVRSTDRLNGWEKAYNAFAECFESHGAKLTERQTQLDLPAMVFNFALKHDWFSHLARLVTPDEMPDLTSPKRVPTEAFSLKPDSRGLLTRTQKECLDWFKARLRPAVLEWTSKASEQEVEYNPFREQLLEEARREPPVSDSEAKAFFSNNAGSSATRISNNKVEPTHWLKKQLNLRGWSTLDLYINGGPDRKTSETYLSGKPIKPKTLKKIVDSLNLYITPNGSKIDINNLPE
jgi:hypothetical protein